MKAIKKALALCLALAMVVTAVPVSTADAAVKSAKLSKSSVTVAGNATKKQTKSVKVTTNADWKNVKVTASSADKKVATVKVSKKTVKVTAVKKGETKVTVNVTGKKSGKKVSKKLTLKVTVCGAGLAVKAPAELTVGDTAKLAVKTTPSTASCTFDVDKKEVATVSDNGTITAVAAGTAKVVVRTDYGKEKIVTVTVKEADKNLSVEAKPTAADTITITANRDVASDTKVAVSNNGVNVDGGLTIVGNVLTFKATSKLSAGTYSVKVTEGEVTAETTAVVENQKVDSIEITSKTVLTNAAKDKAYVYYKVTDQYGVDITANTSVDISTSAFAETKEPSKGKITLSTKPGETFRYNDLVTVSIVCVSAGKVCTASLNIGMEQLPDTIKVAGYLNKNFPTKKEASLPVDFSKNIWYVLYQTYDQDGNLMDAGHCNVGADITVTCDQPLLVDSTFTAAGKTFTVDGVEYDAFKVNPGMNVDKGGKAELAIISNKTGKKSSEALEIGENKILKSLVFGNPGLVTDGSGWVWIPYTATLTDGTTTTDYDAIVRSSNALSVSATAGTLWVQESATGEAQVFWSDNTDNVSNFTDGIDRPVTFTSIVVGGESSYETISVSDMARPVAVKSIAMDEVMVVKGSQKVKLADNNKTVYTDQYGRTMKAEDAAKWLNGTILDSKKNDNYRLAIKSANLQPTSGAKVSINGVTGAAIVCTNLTAGNTEAQIDSVGAYNVDDTQNTLEFSIQVQSRKTGDWVDASAPLKKTITTISLSKVKGLSIESMPQAGFATSNSDAINGLTGSLTGKSEDNISAGDLGYFKIVSHRTTKVVGTYNGSTKVAVPYAYYSVDPSSQLAYWQDGSNDYAIGLSHVTAGALKWKDIYDYNTATLARKAADVELVLEVKSVLGDTLNGPTSKISTKVSVKDETLRADKIEFWVGGKAVTSTSLSATDLAYNVVDQFCLNYNKYYPQYQDGHADWNHPVLVVVKDQYGDYYTKKDAYRDTDMSFNVTDLVEDTSATSHDSIGLGVEKNNSNEAKIVGTELKDTYKITVTVDKVSATLEVTSGADKNAKIDNDANAATDKNFRKNFLHYDR